VIKQLKPEKMAKKETKRAAAKAAPTGKKVKASDKKKAKPIVSRGKTVAVSPKGTKKHEIKKTGEVIRFKHKKHPEREGAHLVNVHGAQVEEGLRMVTPSAQPAVASSLRTRPDIAPGSEFVFATAQDFASIE
jgi:hypothetical protein